MSALDTEPRPLAPEEVVPNSFQRFRSRVGAAAPITLVTILVSTAYIWLRYLL